jgi:hypothetical protein
MTTSSETLTPELLRKMQLMPAIRQVEHEKSNMLAKAGFMLNNILFDNVTIILLLITA